MSQKISETETRLRLSSFTVLGSAWGHTYFTYLGGGGWGPEFGETSLYDTCTLPSVTATCYRSTKVVILIKYDVLLVHENSANKSREEGEIDFNSLAVIHNNTIYLLTPFWIF